MNDGGMNEALRRHSISITVQPGDIDDLGHVNNAVYLRYIEDVARAHADFVGAGIGFMRGVGVVPVARSHLIRYHRPAYEGEELTVSTEVVSASGLRANRHNEVRRARDGELLAEADTEWVWVDPARGRPRPIPRALLEKFGWA